MKRILLILIVVSSVFFLFAGSQAAPGDLYAAHHSGVGSSSDIVKFTPAGSESTFASGLVDPIGGLAFDSAGNLFVSDTGAGSIVKYAPDGTNSTFAAGIGGSGLAFDSAGYLFVAASDTILKFSPNGAKTTFASGVGGAFGLAFDMSGNLFVTANSTILKFTPSGTKIAFASGLQMADSLAFDRAGNLFVSDRLAGIILKFSPSGVKTTFASGLDSPGSLAFDSSDNLFAMVGSAIAKFNASGVSTTFAAPVVGDALAFEPVTEKVRNVSARGLVGTDQNVLIGGFIVGGNALASNAILLRAIGPSLSQFGIVNPLQDPILELHNASGEIIASNDNWQDSQAPQITASGLAPADPHESAIFATLPAGNFTAVVRGVGETSGVALVEVYSVQ